MFAIEASIVAKVTATIIGKGYMTTSKEESKVEHEEEVCISSWDEKSIEEKKKRILKWNDSDVKLRIIGGLTY